MVYVSRTNIDLDDRLVEKVMQMYLLKTKREAVQLALERLVGGPPMTKDEMLAMAGAGRTATTTRRRSHRSRPFGSGSRGPPRQLGPHRVPPRPLVAGRRPGRPSTRHRGGCITDAVILEVLAGARLDDVADTRRLLYGCDYLGTWPRDDWEEAAAIFRRCRQQGFTPELPDRLPHRRRRPPQRRARAAPRCRLRRHRRVHRPRGGQRPLSIALWRCSQRPFPVHLVSARPVKDPPCPSQSHV